MRLLGPLTKSTSSCNDSNLREEDILRNLPVTRPPSSAFRKKADVIHILPVIMLNRKVIYVLARDITYAFCFIDRLCRKKNTHLRNTRLKK